VITALIIVATYLEDLARRGVFVTYSEMLAHFGLPQISLGHRWKDTELYTLLGQIDKQDRDAHRPLRTSSVVLASKVKRAPVPGTGYFTVLCNYRGMPIPRGIHEKRRIHASELRLLWEYYGFRRSDTPH